MQDVTLIGLDLGKHSFHVHGQDRQGKALLRKEFSRKQPIEFFATFHACTVVMEACAGAHHMARLLAGYGHQFKLISPQFVRPFVKSNKNDFIDAEAICEAACRPSMAFRNAENRIPAVSVRAAPGARARQGEQPDRWIPAGVRHQSAGWTRRDSTLAFRAGPA